MPYSSLDTFVANAQRSRSLPKSLADRILAVSAQAIEVMCKEAGEFLLEELDGTQHTEDQIKAVIDLFPGALSYENNLGWLPIQKAACCFMTEAQDRKKTASFVPLLAREGNRLDVGGKGMRGGLLRELPGFCMNAIYFLAAGFPEIQGDAAACIIHEHDRKEKNTFGMLRKYDLFTKNDVADFNILLVSSYPNCAERFEMFVSLDPDALRTAEWHDGTPLIHRSIERETFPNESFELVLKTGMKYFPERLGFLFKKHHGKTACQIAFEKLGVNKTMEIIRRCIPPSEHHTIVHRAAERAPSLVNEIVKYYPGAPFVRDNTGRTLSQVQFHAALRNGSKTYERDGLFFAGAADDQVEEKDPRSGLYPFMLAASGKRSDLDAVYYLLGRRPSLVQSCYHGTTAEDEYSRKRKRGFS